MLVVWSFLACGKKKTSTRRKRKLDNHVHVVTSKKEVTALLENYSVNNSNKKNIKNKAVTYGPRLSEDAIAALRAYGNVTVFPDGTSCIFFTPLHWKRMREVLDIDETAYDAFLLLDETGFVVEFGHAAVRVQEQFRKRCKARAARAAQAARGTSPRSWMPPRRRTPDAQLPPSMW